MKQSNLTFAQKQRLKYIDFRLMFRGYFSRSELVEHFQLGLTSATRDINLYKELAGKNVNYDNAKKIFLVTDSFNSLFDYDPKTVCDDIVTQISNQSPKLDFIPLSYSAPSQLNVLNIDILAIVSRAIVAVKGIKITYVSLTSGEQERTIIPHAIVDNGLRWHVRAYDLKTNQFRDFVFSRILDVAVESIEVQEDYKAQADQQWMRIVPLELVPHLHNIKCTKAIELDYAMQDGMLKLDVRAALVGYLLRRWNVDCTEDASMHTPEHQLWLKNTPTLYGVENLVLASGYQTQSTES